MLRKLLVLSLVMLFVFLLSGTCFAENKLLENITSTQDAIDKLFTGRTLDPIEGIWAKDSELGIVIFKASLINAKESRLQNLVGGSSPPGRTIGKESLLERNWKAFLFLRTQELKHV